jgi:hypothetical protein
MRLILAICFFLPAYFCAQDKLFFSNGTVKQVTLISIAKENVFYKTGDTANVKRINKSELLMVENSEGVRFIFGELKNENTVTQNKNTNYKKNAIGVQPLGLLAGRGTLVFERLINDQKIGLVFPFSITFDPFGSLYRSGLDTNNNSPRRARGVNFLTGLDVNFYFRNKANYTFFIGPRFRYGSDMLLRGIKGYTFQTQTGWRFGNPNNLFCQHLSLGFGFVKVLTIPNSSIIAPKKFFAWYSVNYRININY